MKGANYAERPRFGQGRSLARAYWNPLVKIREVPPPPPETSG
jgi:hypothetical protein